MPREQVEYAIPENLAELDPAASAKLEGIEEGAQADQDGAEIKAAYEVEPNAFTDVKDTKLEGVEDGATADQEGDEMQAAIVSLPDADRVLVGSEPQTGEKKVYGVHISPDGHIETDQESVPEA